MYGGRGGSSNGVRQVGFGFGWFGGRGGEVKVVMVWGHGLNSWISFLVRWGLRYRLFWFGCQGGARFENRDGHCWLS